MEHGGAKMARTRSRATVRKGAKTTRARGIATRKRKRGFGLRVLVLIVTAAFFLGLFAGTLQPSAEFPEGLIWSTENVRRVSVYIAAVRSDGVGIISQLTVEIVPGAGRVLVDTHPLVGFDFQYADRTAVKVASESTGYALDDDGEGLEGADVLFLITTLTEESVEIQAIDGPSAGAATTVATIAALEDKIVKENIIITGTINEDGSIGPVGGIFQKAQAASEAGAELFLVPNGQSVLTMYRVVRQKGRFQFVEPVMVDLNEYSENLGWGIQIREVSTIEEAVDLML